MQKTSRFLQLLLQQLTTHLFPTIHVAKGPRSLDSYNPTLFLMGSYIHFFVYPAFYTRYQIKRINLIVDVNNQIPILGHQLSNFIVNFTVNLLWNSINGF